MSIGPVEYVIIGFPGNKFTGDIAPELVKLVESGVIRLVDLVFIMKDEAGEVAIIEIDEDEAFAAFGTIDAEVGGFIGDEDIAHAAAAIEPGSSVLLILWEDVWATPLVDAIRASGGVLIEGSRIPRELIDAAEAIVAGV
jgi:uncharacterized membrane protein